MMNPSKREGGDTLVERQLLFHEKYWNEEGVRFSLMREASTRKWLERSVHAYHVNIDSHCPVPCSIYSLVVVSRYSYPLISRFLPHLPCPLLLLKAYYSKPVIRLFFFNQVFKFRRARWPRVWGPIFPLLNNREARGMVVIVLSHRAGGFIW